MPRLLLVAVYVLAIAGSTSADVVRGLVVNFESIANPQNPADVTGLGAVTYEYRIGKYEITNAQWNAFVTAAGKPDGYPPKAYDFIPVLPDRLSPMQPVSGVSWYEALQYCNYLTSGDKSKGVYQFSGDNSNPGTFLGIDRDDAERTYRTIFFLPTEDEWYKAAYFKPAGNGYSLYANGTNSPPVAGVDSRYDGQDNTSNSPWNVGTGTREQNGTYDMMGNLSEWTETTILGDEALIRGGAAGTDAYKLSSASRMAYEPYIELYSVGFRIASTTLRKPKKFAIIVGINDGLNCRGDVGAKNVFDALKTHPDWAQGSLGNPQNPFYSFSLQTLTTVISGMDIIDGDTIIFYFNGHGLVAPIDACFDGGEMPPHSPGDELLDCKGSGCQRYISDDQMTAAFGDPKLNNVLKVFLLDACHSGGFEGTTQTDMGDLEKLSKYVLLAAATEGRKAFSDGVAGGSTGQGLWTTYLLPKIKNGVTYYEGIKNYMLAKRGEIWDKYGDKTLPVFGEPGEFAPFEWEPFFSISSDLDPNEMVFGRAVMPGDFNDDGIVNCLDFAGFASYWKKYNPTFDIMPRQDGDGIVDESDLVQFTARWLQGM